MPTVNEHRTKATLNVQFADKLLDEGGPDDWATIVMFYAAVHLVEQLAAMLGKHNDKHPDRFRFLGQNAEFTDIVNPYQKLYLAAEIARYKSDTAFKTRYLSSTIRPYLRDTYLEKIIDFVEEYSRDES